MRLKGSWVWLALGAVLIGGQSMGGGERPVIASSDLPRAYARSKLAMLARRYDDAAIRAAAARWGAVFLPGVPVSALIASGATSMGRHERGGPPDFATGLWGVEWPRVERWARDAQTMRELGRAVPTGAEAFADDIDAQAYVGFRSYAAHLAHCVEALPEALRPGPSDAEWAWRLAISSYSSGEGTVARLVTGAAERLVRVSSARRWAELGAVIVEAARAGELRVGGVSIRGRWRAAHTVVRNEQRYACGIALAETHESAVRQWFTSPLSDDLCAALAEAAGTRA